MNKCAVAVPAAFMHVRDNIEELGKVADDTDLLFLKGLLDSPVVTSLVKVSDPYLETESRSGRSSYEIIRVASLSFDFFLFVGRLDTKTSRKTFYWYELDSIEYKKRSVFSWIYFFLRVKEFLSLFFLLLISCFYRSASNTRNSNREQYRFVIFFTPWTTRKRANGYRSIDIGHTVSNAFVCSLNSVYYDRGNLWGTRESVCDACPPRYPSDSLCRWMKK